MDENSYSELLKSYMNLDNLKDLCVGIELEDRVFPLSFIRDEKKNFLIIDSTDEQGYEKLIIIPKNKIVAIRVVYQQDIDLLNEDTDKKNTMYE